MEKLKSWLEKRIKDNTVEADCCDDSHDRAYYRGKVKAFQQVSQYIEEEAILRWNRSK